MIKSLTATEPDGGAIRTDQSGELPKGTRAASLLANPPKLAVLALCAAVLALRRAEAFGNPQFWAEDIYFYQRAYLLGWNAFLEPFAGYLDIVVRVIAHVAGSVDPHLAPAVFVWGAAAATLCVASRTLSARCPLPHFAGLCALAVVLVPDTYEVLLNLANLQWVLGVGLILLLISGDPAGRWQWVHDAVAAAALGLTGPFCILLLPFFAWRAWRRRTRASSTLAAIIGVCALMQGYLVITEPPTLAATPDFSAGPLLLLPAIARRVGGSLLMGSLLGPDTDQVIGTFAGLATLAGVAYLSLRPSRLRSVNVVLGLVFAALLASAFLRTRHALGLYFVSHADSRYVYIPQLIAIWLLISAAVERNSISGICAALAVWTLAVNIPRLREDAYTDMHWGVYADRMLAGEAVTVPTNPPGWYMHLPARPKQRSTSQ
jgi:hypothetical protein